MKFKKIITLLCLLSFAGINAEEPVTIGYAEQEIFLDAKGSEWKTIVLDKEGKPVLIGKKKKKRQKTLKTPNMPLPFMKDKKTSSLKLLWHETGLYGFLYVTKDSTRQINKQHPWDADSLELFIEKDNAGAEKFKDQKAEHYVFFPDVKGKGPGYYCIPRGAHKTKTKKAKGWQRLRSLQKKKMKKDEIKSFLSKQLETIGCAYSVTKDKRRYSLEFFIPASYLAPAKMKGMTNITLNFCLNDNGNPIEQFAVDKNIAGNAYKPITWATVGFKKSRKEESEMIVEEEPQIEEFAEEETVDLAEKPSLTIEARNRRLDKSEELLEDGKYPEAVTDLKAFTDDYPEDPFALYNYGLALYLNKNFVLAEKVWNQSGTVANSPLMPQAMFQAGNACYRQAALMPDNRKNWPAKLGILRRCIETYNSLEEEKGIDSDLRENMLSNRRIAGRNVAGIISIRGFDYIKEADVILKTASAPKVKIWKLKDLIKKLQIASGKAETDFGDLESFLLENPEIGKEIAPSEKDGKEETYSDVLARGMKEVTRIMEFALLKSARMTRQEVEEAGSTQNNKWTIKMYKTAISFYKQLLELNPKHDIAKKEMAQTKQDICDTFVKEANIELRMATDVVKEDIKEREMKARVLKLKGTTDKNLLSERDKLNRKLNYMEKAYPSSDPEDAIGHWSKAIKHINQALDFSAADKKAKDLLVKTQNNRYEGRKRYAARYIKEAALMPVTNDEEADKKVRVYEKASKNIEFAVKENPSEKAKLEGSIQEIQILLSKSYFERGEIYIVLAKQKKVTHLDRAVAYLQKATQDFQKSYDKDPSFEKANTARKVNDEIQLKWRLELSKKVAELLAKQDKEMQDGTATEDDEMFAGVSVDEDKVRDMVLQEEDPMAGFGEDGNKMPEPIHNW